MLRVEDHFNDASQLLGLIPLQFHTCGFKKPLHCISLDYLIKQEDFYPLQGLD
jgi:hypothetical protein